MRSRKKFFLLLVLVWWQSLLYKRARATDGSIQGKRCIYQGYFFFYFWNLVYNMLLTRSQLENLSKHELINRLLQLENVEDKIKRLNKWFDNVLGKYNELHSELQVSRNWSNLLHNRMIELQKNAPSTAQYVRREIIEINPVLGSISNQNLELQVCKALLCITSRKKKIDIYVIAWIKRQVS